MIIVEDLEPVRKECCEFLRRRFPNLQLDEAESRDDASALLLKAYEDSTPYDCAILDLKLPKVRGTAPESGTSLAGLVVTLVKDFGTRPTWIMQWTAYPEDEAIARFKADTRLRDLGITYEVIPKNDTLGPSKMLNFFDRLLAEKVCGRHLDHSYFKSQHRESVVSSSRYYAEGRPPVSMPGFVQALVDHWQFLLPHRREEALQALQGTLWELVESAGGVELAVGRTKEAMREAGENTEFLGGGHDAP